MSTIASARARRRWLATVLLLSLLGLAPGLTEQSPPTPVVLELRDGVAQPLRLSITNACETAETVQIVQFGLPFIEQLPASIEVPAHQRRTITLIGYRAVG
jgi:hypothetical protein